MRRTAQQIAVQHLMQRLLTDPRLAHLIGPGTESFDVLTIAAAEATCLSIDFVRFETERQLAPRRWSGELLDWYDAAKIKPDAELTVLCWHAKDGEFWTGYWDGEQWIGCESGGTVLGVTYWAVPNGPRGVS